MEIATFETCDSVGRVVDARGDVVDEVDTYDQFWLGWLAHTE
jgi:hypothetical protein